MEFQEWEGIFQGGEGSFILILIFYDWPHQEAYVVLVPQPEIEPMPSVLETPSVNCWTAMEVPEKFYNG